MRRTRLLRHLLTLASISLLPVSGLAYQFYPSMEEWNSWPGYCKARYVTTNVGRVSPYAQMVGPTEPSRWESMLDRGSWLHAHHGCAGVIYLQRANLAGPEDKKYKFLLDSAHSQLNYSWTRITAYDEVRAYLATSLSTVLTKKGEVEQARQLLRQLISTRPELPDYYARLAYIERQAGDQEQAMKVLREGIAASAAPSAELYYFAGLVAIEQGHQTEAASYAAEAYRLGYPLAGLKRKLAKVGVAID